MNTPQVSQTEPDHQAGPSTIDLFRVGAIVGAIAAVVNTAVAGIASAADVSLEVDGKAIPVAAFAIWTFIGALLGAGLARLLRARRPFVIVTTAFTALSLIPAIASPDDTDTKVILVATHLIAAAIIIPAISRRLTSNRTR